ncbi:MAG TPA: hypothetical protein VGP81_00295 [Pyrinomonadaceae bacterium]|jgi:hypothetical protein|nr:hypothetical protein [Pyrinomonadaceae bacterium]
MRKNILGRFVLAIALLIFAIPVVASAQIRIYERDRYDRSDRNDRYDRGALRNAMAQLDYSSARLESDLSVTRGRRVLGGLFWISNPNDNAAIAEVRDFRVAVRQLRRASAGGRDLSGSYDEARNVINQGMRLDRYLRLRTGRTDVDEELAQIRSSLHVIADAYDMNIRY